MTPDDFRRIALSQPGAIECGHMGHADFRAGKPLRVFATLGYPDGDHAMVKLTPEQQEMLVAAEPDAFMPAKGAWGRQGSTLVRLASMDKATSTSALAMARGNLKS